jgi:poly(3-hydroxybutyrate) depolymerase
MTTWDGFTGPVPQRSLRRLRPGMAVRSFEGRQVAQVTHVEPPTSFTVNDGTREYRLRADALLGVDEDTATLICYHERVGVYALGYGLDG